MRRIFSTATIAAFGLIVSAGAVDAQTIGFKLGASLANLDTSNDADLDRRTGFVGGGFVRFGLGPVNLQPELLTVSKGAEAAGTGTDDLALSLEYIEIPVLLHLPLNLGMLSPYLIAGPAFAFEVGCELNAGDVDADCADEGRNKTDIGLAAGGGLEFPMGPGALSVEGRYTWGTTNLVEDGGEDFKIRNRAAYITAGYTIWLGRR